MTSQNTWRAFYPLELRRIHGERGHILKLSFNSNIDLQNKRSEETGTTDTIEYHFPGAVTGPEISLTFLKW